MTQGGTDATRGADDTLAATTPTPGAAPQLARGALVGRYVVLSRLGAGGMGVVYAAYDPELDRKVALKLLRPEMHGSAGSGTASDARTRLLREAQALAKLSHPHVVAIHDVGEHDGAVWLAMEFVDGLTLGAWREQAPRTWREVLSVMEPAGRGLAAAHAAGLVHRDLKPDNLMVGADGRVRVMDFGLARAEEMPAGRSHDARGDDDALPDAQGQGALAVALTRAGSVLGTPAYMAPEQHLGLETDARTDLFSFCVTLWEALYGERPFPGETLAALAFAVTQGNRRPPPRTASVPAWLRRACERGLAVEPAKRPASMSALLAELASGQRRTRLRRAAFALATLAALGTGAESYRRWDLAQRVAACEAAGDAVHAVWNDDARAQVRAGLEATKLSYASTTADKLMPWLDDYALAWRDATTHACLDTRVHATWSDDTLDRATWCLDEQRLGLAALVAQLAVADESTVQRAVAAAAGLPPVLGCTDEGVLAARPAPPPSDRRAALAEVREQLSRAEALLAAGKYADALALSREALRDAEPLDWPPLHAAAKRLEGKLLAETGAYAEGEAASLAAYMEAGKVRAWEVAVPASLDLAHNLGSQQARHAEAEVWAGHAEVTTGLLGDPQRLREATRLGSLGAVHWAKGEIEPALDFCERALVLYEESLGPEHPDVAASLNNLGNVHWAMGDLAEAQAHFERALAIREQALGPEHPDVASSLNNLGNVYSDTGDHAKARALYERALAIYEQALGPEHPKVAQSLNNLGDLDRAAGDLASAPARLERALAIWEKALGPEHPDVAMSLVNLGAVYSATGDFEKARALFERALAILEKALGPGHPNVAVILGNLGDLALAQGRISEAVSWLERAVDIYDAHEGVQENEAYHRFSLAKALMRAGGEEHRARALGQARLAADAWREAGEGMAEELAQSEAFLAEHGSPP